jgi:hypothetical protein
MYSSYSNCKNERNLKAFFKKGMILGSFVNEARNDKNKNN